MLLQTFVQLNILLLAAPALAGWTALPAAHPLLVSAAQVAFLPATRQARSAPQAVKGQRATPQTIAPALLSAAAYRPEVGGLAICPTVVSPTVTRFSPFPHTTRAP